jgi:hypothetical protein
MIQARSKSEWRGEWKEAQAVRGMDVSLGWMVKGREGELNDAS